MLNSTKKTRKMTRTVFGLVVSLRRLGFFKPAIDTPREKLGERPTLKTEGNARRETDCGLSSLKVKGGGKPVKRFGRGHLTGWVGARDCSDCGGAKPQAQ